MRHEFCILGDTLGQHEIGRFKTGIGWAFQKCHEGYITENEFASKLYHEECNERNLCKYNNQCLEIEIAATSSLCEHLSTTYGIIAKSALTELKEFDITKQVRENVIIFKNKCFNAHCCIRFMR